MKQIGILLAASLATAAAHAGSDELLKPFVLADEQPGSIAARLEPVRAGLAEHGFEIVGEYAPYEGAHVIAVTSDELKRTASRTAAGAYAAVQRISLAQADGQVQVAYTNPVYMAHAYRLDGDLGAVAAGLADALGNRETFGAQGLTASKLSRYRYAFGMERFDHPYELAEYKGHQEALQAVEAGVATGGAGVTKVYRVDMPGKQETVFGVAMKAGEGGDRYMDDAFIMSIIDFKERKQVAHLPYEILVRDGKVEALHARFRIALSFPDLKMIGGNSFFQIMATPDAIQRALTAAAGGELRSRDGY